MERARREWQRSDKIALIAVMLTAIGVVPHFGDLRQLIEVHQLSVTPASFAYYHSGLSDAGFSGLGVDLTFHNSGTRTEIVRMVSFVLPTSGAQLLGGRYPSGQLRGPENLKIGPGQTILYPVTQAISRDELLASVRWSGSAPDAVQYVAIEVVVLREGKPVVTTIPLARFHADDTSVRFQLDAQDLFVNAVPDHPKFFRDPRLSDDATQ